MKTKKTITTSITLIIVLVLSGLFYANSITGETSNDPLGENQVIIIKFYGRGCPHCIQLDSFLKDMQEKNPNIIVKDYEIYFNNENRVLFEELSESYNTEIRGVPTIFIDNKIIVGFSSSIGEQIEQEVDRCGITECINPLEKIGDNNVTQIIGGSSPVEDPKKTKLKKTITIPAVISAAVVDAINPCAFAVLIILVTTILASRKRKRALYAGLAFSLSIFISYFLMGLGLYSAIQAAGITHTFYIVVAILAIIIGLFNLKDYLWYGKWFVMEVPLKWRPKMKSLIKGITSIPGAFFVGFIISLFLLPCTSGPYIVILGLLANMTTQKYAIILLLLYNLIFILPMIGITFGIYFGITTTEKAESWRTSKLKTLHLIAGIIILLLGTGMLLSIFMGWL
ncbi:hypothetical protein KAT36_02160 [Candidatus Pacearchaeota archaeon]|nr:hypothetical protein [Candidatus Pacearchaeota archaeon]